jgi:hypothetical protein
MVVFIFGMLNTGKSAGKVRFSLLSTCYYPPPMESGGGYSFGVVRPNFVSRVVLCNYWLEFNETLWESSISRGDAHIVGLFWSDTLTQSYGP